jgi:hypothetical protein
MSWRFGFAVVTLVSTSPSSRSLAFRLAGCQDVGGGADADTVAHSLSGVTLRWMVREVMTSQCGILFDEEELVRNSIPTTVPFPSTPSEADDNKVDIVQPIHDELNLTPAWWMLEMMPLNYTWQDANGVWHSTYRFVAILVYCLE